MNRGDNKTPPLPPVSEQLSHQLSSPSTDMQRCWQELRSISMPRMDLGEGWLMRSPSPAQNGCRGYSKIILLLQPSFCHSYQSVASNYYLFFSYAESQSGVEETTQSFLGAGIKMEENTNDLHCHLMQSVFQIPLLSEGGSREPPAVIGNDTQLS